MIASIFSGLYWGFSKIYGRQLWLWLAGLDCQDNAGAREDIFVVIGLVSFLITLTVVLLFYMIPLEKFKGWLSWMVVLLITALINLFVGFSFSNRELPKMNDWVVYGIDNVECPPDFHTESANDELYDDYAEEDEGCSCEQLVPVDGARPLITVATCWRFGLANAIISAISFFVLSIIVKRFALGGVRRHTPWRSLWP